MKAQKSYTNVGLIIEELFEEIRYEDIVQPAIPEFNKRVARKNRATDRVEAPYRGIWRITIDSEHRSFPAEEIDDFIASFERLCYKTPSSHVAKLVKDTINNRINHTRRNIRSTSFITVSHQHKVER